MFNAAKHLLPLKSPLPATDLPKTGAAPVRAPAISTSRAWRRFGLSVLFWSVVWFGPIHSLIRLAIRSDLYSHVLLAPGIAAYLVWIDRTRLPAPRPSALPILTLLTITIAGCAFIGWWTESLLAPDTRLAIWILCYVLGIGAAGSIFLGKEILRSCAFSFAFLIFLVPLPNAVVEACETGLQHASAEVADWFFITVGTPSIRDGLSFHFPGLNIQVARECSGFRSTLVLFIVGLLAAKMFLRSSWKRSLLVAAIIPLGIFRNAFRIFVLAILSLKVDPRIIDSPLHHKGGPIFFLVSLLPLSALLWALFRSEHRKSLPASRT